MKGSVLKKSFGPKCFICKKVSVWALLMSPLQLALAIDFASTANDSNKSTTYHHTNHYSVTISGHPKLYEWRGSRNYSFVIYIQLLNTVVVLISKVDRLRHHVVDCH